MDAEKEILISVFCTTYNHRKYIRQCLDGMVSQKTEYPFEIIVRDDASTDGTGDIIREYAEKYPELIVPFIQKENMFSQGKSKVSFEEMFRMSRGKYAAVCEGDDFWTDPEKLQLQAGFLETHPDYSVCCTASWYANEDGSLQKGRVFRRFTESRDLSVEDLIAGWSAATNTVVYRKAAMKEIHIPFQGDCVNEDYARMIYLALQGKAYYLDRITGAYRVASAGSFTQQAAKNADIYKARTLEFAAMMDRLDEYTGGKYTDAIRRYRDQRLFDMYANLGDRENMKKYLSSYDNRGLLWRTLEAVRTAAPGPFNAVKDAVRRIRK